MSFVPVCSVVSFICVYVVCHDPDVSFDPIHACHVIQVCVYHFYQVCIYHLLQVCAFHFFQVCLF